jgi:hypothetical protein
MRWTVDGKTVREHENLYGDVRLYFLVSWEIGGKWPGMPTGNTPWPGEVEIDYVRLYEKVPAGQAATSSGTPADQPPRTPAPSSPSSGDTAPLPVSATETPPSAPPIAPEPAAEPTRAAEPEQTQRPEPPAESSEDEVATRLAPQPPPATVAPQLTAPPQWRQASRLDMQRRLSLASSEIPEPSAAPSTQPAPAQVMPRNLADWRAMRDRAWMFRFTD